MSGRDLKNGSQKAWCFSKNEKRKKKEERALFEYALKHILTSSDKWLAWNAYMEWPFRRYIFNRHDRPVPPAPPPPCPKNRKGKKNGKNETPTKGRERRNKTSGQGGVRWMDGWGKDYY
ncbi:hypothetical protein L3Y34_013081 [Caenorhabditis briggsae]|uniref:Uncharacterized protein n=1 Tax=Caenorhabditis briggsae TaxID=6238 RepID=A0AAE8ZSY7_CAEBR|nr:hypothetical protein L3Y34_013081 [Caenorhabditis briggsae]